MTHPTRTRRRSAAALGAVSLVLLLAACGSRLDPDTVAAAGGVGGTAGVPGAVAGDPGAVPGAPGAVAGGGGAAGAAGGSTGGTTGGTTGAAGGGAAAAPGGDNSATGGQKAASCDGFQNGDGITDSTITIGNASDISGPVPGLFEAAQQATRAYVEFFNASGATICGRKLALEAYDSRTDAAADQQAYTAACSDVFAMIGSMSAFDSGGAATAENCGLPDIRSASVTQARSECSTCFGAQSNFAPEFQNAVPDFVKRTSRAAYDNAAMLYVNAGAAAENGQLQAKAMSRRGMTFKYVQGIDVTEFNYAPFVQQMKDRGIEYVQMVAAPAQFVRLAQAMEQQSFEPDVFMIDPTAYDPEFVAGGSAVEGATIFVNFVPFEEASRNAETALYLQWLRQTNPSAEPSFFGLFSWSAARLFVEKATALGGKLSRATLVQEIGKVGDWTANGLHSPQKVGARRTGECWRFLQLRGGKWTPVGGSQYQCNGTTFAE